MRYSGSPRGNLETTEGSNCDDLQNDPGNRLPRNRSVGGNRRGAGPVPFQAVGPQDPVSHDRGPGTQINVVQRIGRVWTTSADVSGFGRTASGASVDSDASKSETTVLKTVSQLAAAAAAGPDTAGLRGAPSCRREPAGRCRRLCIPS